MIDFLSTISSGANVLNNELLNKLKEVDSRNFLKPIEAKIIKNEENLSISKELNNLLNDFKNSLDIEKYFNEFKATTTGESVVFSIKDTSKLIEETININVEKTSQGDIYQSFKFSNKDTLLSGDISINGKTFDLNDKTLEDFVLELNDSSLEVKANIEKVTDKEYRIILKGENGTSNSLSIENGLILGFNEENNHVLKASNFEATINGIKFESSSDNIMLSNGLNLTSLKLGETSIKIEKDKDIILDKIQTFVDNYNSITSKIKTLDTKENTTIIENVLKNIKQSLFSNSNLLDFLSFDNNGKGILEFNSSKFENNIENQNNLLDFTKTSFNSLENFINNDFTKYLENINNNGIKLQKEQQEMITKLDNKYLDLGKQFSSYATIITQMENNFSSLKQIILEINSNK